LREGVVCLPDGRSLGYGEYGARGGKPLLIFHGYPGGRQFDQGSHLKELGLWAFVLERPGFGLSDPKPGRQVIDWPVDVAAFADTLGLDRFAIAGFSAGAPYALACGRLLAGRVTMVGLVCGFLTFLDDPSLDEIYVPYSGDRITRYRSHPDAVLAEVEQELSEKSEGWAADPDGYFREQFGPMADSMPEFWKAMLGSTLGGQPDVDDPRLRLQPMGFKVEDILVPIYAWYGDQDSLLRAGQELCRRVPSVKLTVYPGEGHMINPRHRRDWLSALADWY
jgi:pimeloyl-ACP methyl ester carboxylesterase